jgi:Holliday junction resolvase RusA-like endonuclease
MNDTRFFMIPGEPQGKGRPRFMKNGHAYTPSKTAAYESIIRACYLAKYKGEPFPKDTALCITIMAVFQPPKSTPKKWLARMLEHVIRPIKKPDIDNVAKVIMDGLSGHCYYDDKSIVELHVYKIYGEESRVEVCVREADGAYLPK